MYCIILAAPLHTAVIWRDDLYVYPSRTPMNVWPDSSRALSLSLLLADDFSHVCWTNDVGDAYVMCVSARQSQLARLQISFLSASRCHSNILTGCWRSHMLLRSRSVAGDLIWCTYCHGIPMYKYLLHIIFFHILVSRIVLRLSICRRYNGD